MQKRARRKAAETALVLCLFLVSLGCTEEGAPAQPGEQGGAGFDAALIDSFYQEAGITQELLQKIDSQALLNEAERAELDQKLSQFEQRLGQARGYPDTKEGRAMRDLVTLELSRASYLRLMVALKDSGRFTELSSALGSFDFSRAVEEGECTGFEGAGALWEKYQEAELAAVELSEKIRQFGEMHPEFSAAAKAEQRKPQLENTGLKEFVESSLLLFEGCSALNDSMAALRKVEEFARQESLCIGLNDLDTEIKSLEAAAENLDSFSKRAASIAALSLSQSELGEMGRSLLSVSSELRGFFNQLREEC